MLPKPWRDGATTGGPSSSRHWNLNLAAAPLPSIDQWTEIWPPGCDRAPCLVALVASSCTIRPKVCATRRFSMMAGPAALTRSEKASSSSRTISARGAPSKPPATSTDWLRSRQAADRDRLDHGQQVLPAVRELVHQEALVPLDLLALGDVEEAVDRSRGFAALILDRPDVHQDDDPRAVGPFDLHFGVADFRHSPVEHLGHRTELVRHETVVRTEHLEGAAKFLVGIAQRGLAAPQFGGAAVEILDRARDVAGIDGHGPQLEQGAIAFLAFAQRRFGLLALDDLALQLEVQQIGHIGELVLAYQAEHQRLVHGEHLFLESCALGHGDIPSTSLPSVREASRRLAAGAGRW